MKTYFAARYYYSTDPKSGFEIALYDSRRMSEECPHDYILSFSRSNWKALGCRLPGREETIEVGMSVQEKTK